MQTLVTKVKIHNAAMTKLVELCESSEAVTDEGMRAGSSFLSRLWTLRDKPEQLATERERHWQFCAYAMVTAERYEQLETLDAASMMYYRCVAVGGVDSMMALIVVY